jgi:hypothetical protein
VTGDKVMKTVLAPSAPWPTYEKKVVPKPLPRVRPTAAQVDAKFEAWLLTIKPVSRRERVKK